MKLLIQLFLVVVLSACTKPQAPISEIFSNQVKSIINISNTNPTYKAIQYINFSENTHRKELKEFIGVDPKRTEWCAAFINAVLEESGIESNKDHAYPLTARAFLDWGQAISKENIQPGDIVVFPRGNQAWQGHVGFYIKTIEMNGVEYYYILGGNQSNKVSIEMYRSSRVLGIRRQTSI